MSRGEYGDRRALVGAEGRDVVRALYGDQSVVFSAWGMLQVTIAVGFGAFLAGRSLLKGVNG